MFVVKGVGVKKKVLGKQFFKELFCDFPSIQIRAVVDGEKNFT